MSFLVRSRTEEGSWNWRGEADCWGSPIEGLLLIRRMLLLR
jgi:hypothetical protein